MFRRPALRFIGASAFWIGKSPARLVDCPFGTDHFSVPLVVVSLQVAISFWVASAPFGCFLDCGSRISPVTSCLLSQCAFLALRTYTVAAPLSGVKLCIGLDLPASFARSHSIAAFGVLLLSVPQGPDNHGVLQSEFLRLPTFMVLTSFLHRYSPEAKDSDDAI